ncbi:arylsulfatase [Clostridium grantii]|uniref:Arylsulfatase A n=1 Tax=Clostridium grantii DSM 8605 TaxID=1121316 RepID=A0A1M5T534_9CLOT|nr:arylsulfatase [Clostridium grantii]SHH45859.1 Arylsulfatase A [Clostridium grantii DSM 8605]
MDKKIIKPNVILIITDDQGYGDVGCNGNPWLKTPNLDAMHDDSIRLCDYHTDPMCAPTRAAVLTGQYSMRVGVWSTLNGRYYLNKNTKTMADFFHESGYKTGIFGKWHMGDEYPYRACDRGFDQVVSFGGGVIGETPDYWDNDYFNDKYIKNGETKDFTGYCTDVWFDETISFIEDNKNKPFFCYLPTNAPHDPYNVNPKYAKSYLQQGLSDKLSKFYGMISNIDENIGRLENKLKQLGILDNTIIIFMGDNGSSGITTDAEGFVTDGYNANMRGKKGQVYQGSHKNNCFIQWHNGKFGKPRDVNGLTSHIDLLPTLIDCCNLKGEGLKFDGISIAKDLVEGKDALNKDRKLIIHCMQLDYPEKYKDFTVLTQDYAFIKTKNDDQENMLLFDMKNDYGQKKNIIKENMSMCNEYIRIYEKWWDDVTSNGQYDYSYINIGHDDREMKLTCHAWHGNTNMAYSQINIRKGIYGSGYWTLEVEKEGKYSIELRRWPRETNLLLSEGVAKIPATEKTHQRPEGKVYEICGAKISIQGNFQIQELSSKDSAATFIVDLHQGKTKLQTWFLCKNGDCIGAYYIYIKYIS